MPNPTIIKMTALDHRDAAHNPVMARHYGITSEFVKRNMKFGSNSFVYMDCCFLAAAPFRDACTSVGASLYAGWTEATGGESAARAARFIFDRMTGDNSPSIDQENPKQRPFDYTSALSDLRSRGWATSNAAQLVITPVGGDCGILAPSILMLNNDDVSSDVSMTLSLVGYFGKDPGAANRSVTLGGQPLNIKSWGPDPNSSTRDMVVCDKVPLSGAGGAGDCIVNSYGHQSNKVPLTEWVWSLQYTLHAEGRVISLLSPSTGSTSGSTSIRSGSCRIPIRIRVGVGFGTSPTARPATRLAARAGRDQGT